MKTVEDDNIPLFLRSIESKETIQDIDVSDNVYCYSKKYQGYCIFQKPNRWKSIAIFGNNKKD